MKKSSITGILFFIILCIMFMGAMHPSMTYLCLIGAFFVAFLIGVRITKQKDYVVPIGLIYLLSLQNFCVGVGAHMAGNMSDPLKFITQIPFMVTAVLWILLELKKFKKEKISKERKWFYLYLICIAFSYYISRGALQTILMNVRNMTVFYMAFEIGKYNLDSKEAFDSFYKAFMKLAKIMLVAGIVLLFGGYSLYSKIGVDEVYFAKGDYSGTGTLNGRFSTVLISRGVRRMGSLYYEPVNLAYFFGIGLILGLFYNGVQKEKRKMDVFVNGIGLFLTFGKGGYLVVACAIFIVVLDKILTSVFYKTNKKKILKLTIFFVFTGIIAFCLYYYYFVGASSLPHFWSVIRTWDTIKAQPYGYGLGMGGNMAQLFNNSYVSYTLTSSSLSTGSESAIMTFMYQLGIQGIVCLLVCLIKMKPLKKENANSLHKVMSFMPIILFGVAILQENTFTPQCIIPFMLVQGALANSWFITYEEGEI